MSWQRTGPEYTAAYLKVLGQLEQVDSNEPLVQAALGRRDLKKGDFQAAAAHLRRALEKDPNTSTTYSDLADALRHLGDTEQADTSVGEIDRTRSVQPGEPQDADRAA